MTRPPRVFAPLLSLWLCSACASDPTSLGDARSEPQPARFGASTPAAQRVDPSTWDTTDEPTQPSADEPSAANNGSFATAKRIDPGGPYLLVDETNAEQVDYYVFTAKAGTYYEISTDNDRYSPDNVVTLYDADRKLVATNDDGAIWPGDKYDARLIVRAPRDGDYYVRVEDPFTPPEFFLQRFRLLYYRFEVRPITADTKGFTLSGPPRFEHDEQIGYAYATVLGSFDEDQETVSFDGVPDNALIARVHPGGRDGDGSSVREGRVTVAGQDGRLLASIDRGAGPGFIRPPISGGSHRITLERKGDAGDNPFYAIDLVLLPDNPSEQDEVANARAAGAETVALSRGSSGRALLLSRLQTDDIDYWRIPSEAANLIVVSCEAESMGSGIRDLTVELRDAGDRVLATAHEDATGLLIEHLVSAPGPYFVRFSVDPITSASAVEPWVRCGLIVN